MFSRKGLSPIIITVLVIVFSLAAIGVIWAALRETVGPLNEVGETQTCLGIYLEISECAFNSTMSVVRVRRGAGSGDISALRFVFEGESTVRTITAGLPSTLETRTYSWTDVISPTQVDVAAVIGENTCALTRSPRTCVQVDSLQAPQCSDGIDNEGDGATDYPNDFSCASAADNDETNPLAHCQDGIDNDIDGLTDYPADLGCESHQDNDETEISSFAACDDGEDNDEDGLIDWPIDPGCSDYLSSETEDPARSETLTAFAWWPIEISRENLVKMYVIGEKQTRNAQGNVDSDVPNPSEAAQFMLNRSDPRHRVMKDRDTLVMDRGGLIDPFVGNVSDYCRDSFNLSFDCRMWYYNSSAVVRQRYQDFFTNFTANGGQVTMMVLDLEATTPSNWHIGFNVSRWEGIRDDPRFAQEGLNTQLTSIGIPDITVLADPFTEPGRSKYPNWNALMNERSAISVRGASYDIVRSFFPTIKFSDYGFNEMDVNRFRLPDSDGHAAPTYQSDWLSVGTHQAPNIYGCYRQLTWRTNALPGTRYYPASSFNALRWEINNLRAASFSSARPITPWIGARESLSQDIDCYFQNTDYYQESLLHASLLNVESFLYWNYYPSLNHQTAQDSLVSDTLAEFDTIAGYAGRSTIARDNGNSNVYESNELVNWTVDYYMTGMQSGNRIVWRFTPNLRSQDTINQFIIREEDPLNGTVVMRSQNSLLSFPQGALYNPADPVSDKGVWIVQPVNAVAPYYLQRLPTCILDANDDGREDSTGAPCIRQCYDGIDNDGDGGIDSEDYGCWREGRLESSYLAQCQDGIDNDNDGLTDWQQEPASNCTSHTPLGALPQMDDSER